ncbi:MAG: STAS domain-containing protein, partial [Desulfatitalea sp.]|nr:STAS domain-containing protein [Desulfatitalea sp.]NNK02565.1 STAS domain-containing protein [Desulfatitalea sp.]
RQIFPVLTSAERVSIDLSAVTECDGAGIQMVCQMWRAMQVRGKSIRMTAVSTKALAAMQLAGMDAQFLSAHLNEV